MTRTTALEVSLRLVIAATVIIGLTTFWTPIAHAQVGIEPIGGGGAPANLSPPEFTDTRVTPTGHDLLKVYDPLTASTVWSIDLTRGYELRYAPNQPGPGQHLDGTYPQVANVFNGSGVIPPGGSPPEKNVDTAGYFKTYFPRGGVTVYYQYIFQYTRDEETRQGKYYGPINEYALPLSGK